MELDTERKLVRQVIEGSIQRLKMPQTPYMRAMDLRISKLDPEAASIVELRRAEFPDDSRTPWGVGFCGECGEESKALVTMGDPGEYAAPNTDFCRACLLMAVALIDAAEAKGE